MANTLSGGFLNAAAAEQLGVDSVQVFREILEARNQVEYTVFFRDPADNKKSRFEFTLDQSWFDDKKDDEAEALLLARCRDEIRRILDEKKED